MSMEPHRTNTRAQLRSVAEKYASFECLFGLEQEYTFLKSDGTPLGFPTNGYPAPQGPYYCGVGTNKASGRAVVEAHYRYCLGGLCMLAFCSCGS